MLRKYVQVDENNVAICPAYVHGEVDAPFPVVPHENPEDVEIGTRYDGFNWVQTDELVRSKRDNLLISEVDVIAGNPLRWDELTEEQKAQWAAYRIQLLNVPDQDGFPQSINWPLRP